MVRADCFVCGERAEASCLRCEGRLCVHHTPEEDKRCFACEWLGYHLRWIWRQVAVSTFTFLLIALLIVLTTGGGPVMYLLSIPLGLAMLHFNPFSALESYKRRLFLAERLPGLWYEHARRLRGGSLRGSLLRHDRKRRAKLDAEE